MKFCGQRGCNVPPGVHIKCQIATGSEEEEEEEENVEADIHRLTLWTST